METADLKRPIAIPAIVAAATLAVILPTESALAHAIGGSDANFVAATYSPAPGPFMYLGAKHMVTGYDHLLFLLGVVFFLRRFRDVVLLVSLFSLGHSITLLAGVLLDFGVNAYLVDAAIGLSVAYKAFDNLGGFERLIGIRPKLMPTIFAFGLIHGLGLASKLQELRLNRDGLVVNLLSFNLGVEVGQVMALSAVLALILLWQRSGRFGSTAVLFNWSIMTAGFVLMGYQFAGYFLMEG